MCHPSHAVGSFLNTSSSQISHYNHSRKLEHSHGGTYGRQAWNQETILQYNSAWLFFSHWSQPHCVMLTPNAYHSQFTSKALNWHNTAWLLLCSSHTKQCSSELEMMSKYNTWHAGCCVCNYTHHVHQDMMTNYWLTPSIKPCEFVWLFSKQKDWLLFLKSSWSVSDCRGIKLHMLLPTYSRRCRITQDWNLKDYDFISLISFNKLGCHSRLSLIDAAQLN